MLREKIERTVKYGEECQRRWQTEHPVLWAFTAYDFESCMENGEFLKLKRRNELAKQANEIMSSLVHGVFMVEDEKQANTLVNKFGWKMVDVITRKITNPGTGFTSDRTFTVVEN